MGSARSANLRGVRLNLADVETAIRLGAKDWIYAKGKLHLWESGWDDSPCHVGATISGFQEAYDWLSGRVVVDGALSSKTVAEVIDLQKKICAVCAMAWRGEF